MQPSPMPVTAGLMQMYVSPTKFEQIKAEFIDYLYVQSGRTNEVYTGLWQEHCRTCGEAARMAWHDFNELYTP